MNKLPPEIFEHIISLIPRKISVKDLPKWDGLKPLRNALPTLATVSRGFQRAIERRTFHSIGIQANDEELTDFERILDPDRRSHVRRLYVNLPAPPCLPEPTIEDEDEDESESGNEDESESGNEDESQYESKQDRQAHREMLTAPLRRLWNFISTWDESANQGIYLSLDTDGPRNLAPEDIYRPSAFSLLDLTSDVHSFPPLPCVGESSFGCRHRHWNPRVPVALISTMTRLQRVEWLDQAQYDWGRYYSIDKKYRHGFVQSAQTTSLPPSLRMFTCQLKAPYYDHNHTQMLPRFIEDGAHDPVSCAIRKLTRHCIDVSLEGPFHPSLFDPPSSITAVEGQCWQHTTSLSVKMLPSGPDGSWLYRPQVSLLPIPEGLIDCTLLPPGYANTREERKEAEDYFDDHKDIVKPRRLYEYSMLSLVPNDDKLNAMIVAFGRCCARMPALKTANVRFEDNHEAFPYQVIFIAAFYRVGVWDADMANSAASCRIYIHMKDWRPTDATVAELKNVGMERYGQPSTIDYLEWGDFYD